MPMVAPAVVVILTTVERALQYERIIAIINFIIGIISTTNSVK